MAVREFAPTVFHNTCGPHEADYGLDLVAACTLLGQCVQYDISNVLNPAYTVACKVPKGLLPSAGAR